MVGRLSGFGGILTILEYSKAISVTEIRGTYIRAMSGNMPTKYGLTYLVVGLEHELYFSI